MSKCERKFTNIFFSFLDGHLKFSSAVLPESLASLNIETNGASGESFQNFYSKTRDIHVDEGLIKQLKDAQKAIDDGEDDDYSDEEDEEDNLDTRSLADGDTEEGRGRTVFSSLADFGGAGSGGLKGDEERCVSWCSCSCSCSSPSSPKVRLLLV